VLIYLRHGDDRRDDEYRHDRSLTDRGREKSSKEAKRLIEKYGHPVCAYVSPFRRTIETLDAMSARFERPVAVRRDARIAQYLGHKRDPQVSPETAAAITLTEDKGAFRQRVADHLAEMQRRTLDLIWCITHQAVIDEIGEQLDVKIPSALEFLDHVVMLG